MEGIFIMVRNDQNVIGVFTNVVWSFEIFNEK